MKVFKKWCSAATFGFCAVIAITAWGCGGGSSKTNVITVSVSPASASVIVSQSLSLTAIVSGSTNLNVTWSCQYTTTTVDSAGKPLTGNKNNCTNDTGNIPAGSTNTTVVYTAPAKAPDPTKLPGTNCTGTQQTCLLTIIITATSAADAKKTGASNITIDSGISVSITPGSATVPTNEQQQFVATLTNDLQNSGVTWLVTQGTPTSAIPYPALPDCSKLSPSCGTIDPASGLYKAPGAVPTTPTLTVVATSKADPTRFSIAFVTVITGGAVTFNGLSPTVAPQGASSYDLYLAAPFASSASFVTITGQKSGTTTINSGSGQLKVLFPIPTSTVTNPASTGLRLRLNVDNLATADTYTVQIKDPAACVDTNKVPIACPGGPFTFSVVPVRPTSIASLPDSVMQNNPLKNAQSLAIDGGYFGPQGALVQAILGFNGNKLTPDPNSSSSRRLNLALQSSDVNSTTPGLYELAVASTTPNQPPPNNPSITDLAIFPDYSSFSPSVVATANTAGANPSAVDIDTRLGVMAVAEPGSNQIEFFNIGSKSLTSSGIQKVTDAGGNPGTPTGLSINQSNHTVAVVDYQNQGVIVFPLPGQAGDPNVTYPVRIPLGGLIPNDVNPQPLPYSIGVDADTNIALVAYSSTGNPTTAKVGFLVDLNKNTAQTCLRPNGGFTGAPCVHAQVTLNTGVSPQVAMLPHSHTAFVTPGGAGFFTGIDVTKASTSTAITSVSLTSGLVTVVTSAPHNLTPGALTTVLINGVSAPADQATSKVDFNGVFTVQSVINATSFTYALNSSFNDTSTGGTAFYSAPNVVLSLSQTDQGIAINPITRTAAISDANATGVNGAQIDFLNSLDQSVTSVQLHAGCTAFTALTTPCAGSPELLGTTAVAFQPYTNALVSYNPNPKLNAGQQDQVSIIDPVTRNRYAFVSDATDASDATHTHLSGTGSATIQVAGSPLSLFGGLAVDPATNQAFVVQSGSNDIRIVDLGPMKSAEITELQVPTVANAQVGGIAGASMSQGTLTSSTPLANVDIYGAGFDGSTQVRLDGAQISSAGAFISTRHLRVTIPASFLSLPHRYAVDVVNSLGEKSNATDFFVVQSVDLSKACSGGNPKPSSVAIADQLPGQGFAPIAVVSNSGCNNVSVIDINPADVGGKFGTSVVIPTGGDPIGVAVSPRFGLAVVANNTDGTASILDLVKLTQKTAAVTVGATPSGVAINEGTGAALIANTGSATVSEINLTVSPPTVSTIGVDQSPLAVAIDPDRGTNGRGLAVVTALELLSGTTAVGALDAVDIGGAIPAKSTTVQAGTVNVTPSGIVFDPTVSPALFYANSSSSNVVTSFNPDSGQTSTVGVGINPTSLAMNPQTGAILTVNSLSQTISIIDTISNPFKTRRTYGIGGSLLFSAAIDQFTNFAVIADQAHNRVLIFPMPN